MAGIAIPEPGVGTDNRRERRKRELQARILDAATSLFEDKGVEATTVAEICDRADVATKTFFNHFSTKQQLVERLAVATLESFLADLEDLRCEVRGFREWILRFFEQIAASVTAAGPMHREFVTELVHAISSDEAQPSGARQLREAFRSVVRDGALRGEIATDHEVETQTELILGAFYSLMFSWTHLEDYPMRARARAMAQLLGDSLASTPTPERKESAHGPS